ncbi:MAG: single-stranded DNA-binding protein [Clostridia bacterium]|nr:single-stranded DNA-binding protein [Clostridia bacterium]
MNKVMLIGNLTRDPELVTTNSGISLCKFGLAVQRRFSSNDGEKDVDFFNIVVWRGPAENCYKYLKKGSKVGIMGSIQTRNYESNDGTKKFAFDIVAEEIEFLSSKAAEGGMTADMPVNAGSKTTGKSDVINTFTPIDDNDLPF